jgi:hypothetical protein
MKIASEGMQFMLQFPDLATTAMTLLDTPDVL